MPVRPLHRRVGELALDAGAESLDGGAGTGFDVTGKIEVDQAVGSVDLHFGLDIGGGLNERRQAALRSDFRDRFHRLEPDIGIGIAQQILEARQRTRPLFHEVADIFRAQRLLRGSGEECQCEERC